MNNVAKLKSGEIPLFPEISRLVSALICLPISNATVERVFSVMSAVKTKLRNILAIPMVESILTVRYRLKRRGENCVTMKILPEMLALFNVNMYDHKRAQPQRQIVENDNADEEDENQEFIDILDEVEEFFGESALLAT